MGFAPTWLRRVGRPPASQNHFNHWRTIYAQKQTPGVRTPNSKSLTEALSVDIKQINKYNKWERLLLMLATSYPGVSVEVFEKAGWILIQRKVTGGAQSFDQDWAAYSDGFGTASPSSNDNYWLGLKHVYRLLQLGTDKLRIKVGKLFHCVRILSGNVKYRIMPLSEGENTVRICNFVWRRYGSGTGIVEWLEIIDVWCSNLKQFDVEADRKCIFFLFSAVNENADENEIPFSAEKRKRRSPVPISQNLVTVQLRT